MPTKIAFAHQIKKQIHSFNHSKNKNKSVINDYISYKIKYNTGRIFIYQHFFQNVAKIRRT